MVYEHTHTYINAMYVGDTKAASYGEPNLMHRGVVHHGAHMYFIGGTTGGIGSFSHQLISYNDNNDTWHTLSPCPSSRIHCGIIATDDHIFVIGTLMMVTSHMSVTDD